jgi:hypothetical protein
MSESTNTIEAPEANHSSGEKNDVVLPSTTTGAPPPPPPAAAAAAVAMSEPTTSATTDVDVVCAAALAEGPPGKDVGKRLEPEGILSKLHVVKEEVGVAVKDTAPTDENDEMNPTATIGTANADASGTAAGAAENGVKDEPDNDGEEDDMDATSIKSEGADEEDALFTNLEQEEEKEEAIHPHHQPKDAAAAPKLLQQAIQAGEVKEDSDTEEKKGEISDSVSADGKMKEDENDHHHQRVSF